MVNQELYKIGSKRAPVRELFEYGKKKAQEIGAENVFDFSLGNPSTPAPAEVRRAVLEILDACNDQQLNGYTSTQGDMEARNAVAQSLNERFQTNYSSEEIFMTAGAAPGLVGCVRTLLIDSNSEILVQAPFFTEYRVYATANGGKLTVVPADIPQFQINFPEMERLISVHTQALIINSPNNPSGVIYTEQTIRKLAALLERKSAEYGHPIYIIADEPYRELVYTDSQIPWIPAYYKNTLVCYSYSKSLSLPGQRIGWVLIPKQMEEHDAFLAAFTGAMRAFGQVCAPSLYQKVIARCAKVQPDLTVYRRNRDLLYENLTTMGYRCAKADGTFYLFLEAPDGDAAAFSDMAREEGLLLPAGGAYGAAGYLRISYCVPTEQVERSLPVFQRLLDKWRGEQT